MLAGCAYDPVPTYPVVYEPARTTVPIVSMTDFDRLDTNRDGFLSRGELEPLGMPAIVASGPVVSPESPASAFQRLDVNRDGYLSRAEAGTTFNIPGGSFDSFDANRDGYLSMAEAMPHMQWMYRGTPTAMSFDALDVDRDGFLTRAEAAPLLGNVRWVQNRWIWNTARVPTASFDALDTNRDGFISRAEAAAAMNTATFGRYDTNRDGFLSRIEADPYFRWGVGATPDYPYGGTVYGPRY
jgi:hypothetical protein